MTAETPAPGIAAKPVAAAPPRGVAGLLIATAVGLMILCGLIARPGVNLLLITGLMALVMIAMGIGITRRPLGVLINKRNLMSLSRFQMAIWTVVVLGSYFTFALARIKKGDADPLNIQMDWHLWALLGISTTALVGTPLILSTKQGKQPADSVVEKAAKLVDEDKGAIDVNREGTLYVNASMADARLTDMFQGDELENIAHIDLAKVQMFYFTVIAVVAFFVMVFSTLVSAAPDLHQLPVLPDGLVAILGISNAGYLTSKGVDHTKLKDGSAT